MPVELYVHPAQLERQDLDTVFYSFCIAHDISVQEKFIDKLETIYYGLLRATGRFTFKFNGGSVFQAEVGPKRKFIQFDGYHFRGDEAWVERDHKFRSLVGKQLPAFSQHRR